LVVPPLLFYQKVNCFINPPLGFLSADDDDYATLHERAEAGFGSRARVAFDAAGLSFDYY
jgi:hypothetical protein